MITFEITKNVSELFDFITSYFNLNKTELLISWRKMGVRYPSYSVNQNDEKVTFDVTDLPDDEKGAFSYFFHDILKTDKNTWLECHIKEFCVQKLNSIIGELSGHTGPIVGNYNPHIRKRTKYNPDVQLPPDFHDYLYGFCPKSAAYQYDVAFRNHIVPELKEQTGENFWDIKDINRIIVMMNNNSIGVQKTALNCYIRYLRLQKQQDTITSNPQPDKGPDRAIQDENIGADAHGFSGYVKNGWKKLRGITTIKSESEKNSDESDWFKIIEDYISKFCESGDYSYKGEQKYYLAVVLDILRTENRPMTIDEVRYKCFSNYNRYGIKKDDFVGSKSASVIIYECLYQHSDYNHNHNAAKQYKFFTCDVDGGHSRNNRYAFRQGLILW